MRAFKCDRCGKLYEGYESEYVINSDDYSQITISGNGFSFCNDQQFLYGLDLCQDCFSDLMKWFTEERYAIE